MTSGPQKPLDGPRLELLRQMRELRSRLGPAAVEKCRKSILAERDPGPKHPGHGAVALFLAGRDPSFLERVVERAREEDRREKKI